MLGHSEPHVWAVGAYICTAGPPLLGSACQLWALRAAAQGLCVPWMLAGQLGSLMLVPMLRGGELRGPRAQSGL